MRRNTMWIWRKEQRQEQRQEQTATTSQKILCKDLKGWRRLGRDSSEADLPLI
jgi:hypothetical protein